MVIVTVIAKVMVIATGMSIVIAIVIVVVVVIVIVIVIPTACAVGWLKRKRHAADLVHLYRAYRAASRPNALLISELC